MKKTGILSPLAGTESKAEKSAALKAGRVQPSRTRSARSQTFYTPTIASLQPDQNIGLLIKQVQSSLNRMIDQHVVPLGLTAMQWRPMVIIRYRGINTPAELSRQSQVDTGAMTRTLDRLEAKGFVTRHRCPDDRRVVRVELTETGNAVAEQILPSVATSLNAHLAGFSKAEVESLLGMLHRMLSNGGNTTDMPFSVEH
jgi:DNA-binding MarR family transcriptional regulator